MKQLMKLFGIALAITFSQSVFAGAGEDCHFHGNKPAAKETVLKCADQRKGKLIARGKIDAGWGSIKHESITTIDGEKGKEWKVTFSNPAFAILLICAPRISRFFEITECSTELRWEF